MENGSGLVLATARVPALVKMRAGRERAAQQADEGLQWRGWRRRACCTAMSAPPSGRITVWTASQTESTQGILSAMNSIAYIASAAPMIQVVVEDAVLRGQR